MVLLLILASPLVFVALLGFTLLGGRALNGDCE